MSRVAGRSVVVVVEVLAASFITSLPLIIAFFLVQRSMVRVLTARALTGT